MMMKKLLAAILLANAATAAFALDNEAWLAKARECVSQGFMMDSDETEEDGMYCLVITAINTASGKSADVQVGEAVLAAKRKITAFVKGETVSASREVSSQSETVTVNGEKISKSYRKFEKRIKTKVNALIKGVKILGQVTSGESSYVVCLTCEKFEYHTAALEKAQSQYGEEGVVVSVGEGTTHEIAKQKAIRGAVEQVLGTVVVGYDKMSSTTEFQSKVFSGSDGVVEKYRIISDTEISIGRRVEIVAKVSKGGLLDNYSNYMKFLGDPAFYIDCGSPDLASHFTDFFTEMGIRIAPVIDGASYVIHCTGEYRTLEHPVDDGRMGVQLSLRFRVFEINGKETLIDMKNDPRRSACFTGTNPERQKEICAQKAFKQMKKPLHGKIQAMIGKLVGRKMDAATVSDDDED